MTCYLLTYKSSIDRLYVAIAMRTVDDGLRFHCLDNINDSVLISNVSSFHKPET